MGAAKHARYRHLRHEPEPPGRVGPVAAIVVTAVAAAGGLTAAWALTRSGDDPGGPTAVAAEPGDAPSTTTTAAPATTTTTTRDPVLGNGQSVTLAFGGDVHFEGRIAGRLADDPGAVFGGFGPILAAADVAVVNMETVIGVGGTPAPKAYTFQVGPEAFEAFRAAGIDVVSAANNHGMDFGPDGLQETLAAEAAAGYPVVGIGQDDAEAFAPHLIDVRGQRVAVIAATQVLDAALLDEWTAMPDRPGLASAKRVDRLVQEVTAARALADTVVVYLHWGTETQTCPNDAQLDLSQRLADAGADVIVGGHAHRLQGGGRLGGAVVHYGLGNFAFYTDSGEGTRTGVFAVTVTGRRVDHYRWVPGRITDHQPNPLEGEAAADAATHWESLRACTNLSP